nr:PREDICTED: keratin-associated protein 4-3-like [Opisthocomus hoazin]
MDGRAAGALVTQQRRRKLVFSPSVKQETGTPHAKGLPNNKSTDLKLDKLRVEKAPRYERKQKFWCDYVTAAAAACRPSTCRPSTCRPSTCRPSTCRPSTCRPSTCRPSTCRPSTCRPSTCRPSTCRPSTCRPSTCRPSTCRPSTCRPSTCRPSTCRPSTCRPSTCRPRAGRPVSAPRLFRAAARAIAAPQTFSYF